ncbi:MAG: MFS transporter [Microbacterium sp.]|uniref:MFS transporter n=1 Tax=Microbacterium sp. TaxID=51671 RepID=UPI001ACB370C|nr:MFS transporter [Microbacterium sp.]MBN9153052.1 MFS transporter [Microbacterium sp.]MBN9174963.1 MFS transporter [Microbacterium sp.]MBN9184979.1 MFS transporter [Microbacterium sp.]MBN9188190.1 MFS transporter [Microbacterium sp.]MBN9191640.1 MFS transporter [Microbacterium sp.]
MTNSAPARVTLGTLAGVVGFLAFVEFTSGVLQGYYTPLLTNIARHLGIHDADVNWLEGTQLMLSALVVPAFAKLGDMIGHKRMLLISTALTGLASLVLPFTDNFGIFLAGWALMGFYVVWLPLEIALIWSRSRRMQGRATITARAAGILVAALETGAIVGALVGGALGDILPLWIVLLVPSVMIVICFFVVLFGVKESPDTTGGVFDTVGLVLISLALIAFTGGLSLLRINGPADILSWLVVILGIALVGPFVLWELRHKDPLIDVRMFRSPALGPVFLTAGLFGVSVLGAQAPLSTFARTDPSTYGYGLGTSGFATSLIIGVYLIAMITGALLYPLIARRTAPRLTLIGAAILVGVGFLLFLPFHASYAEVIVNMVIVGLGSGALVAALPAAAASAAPATQTGVATGLTNSVKTVGGAIASCVFGIALLHGATGAAAEGTAGSFAGYVTVWLVCGLTAFASAVLLLFVPKDAFSDRAVAAAETQPAAR